MTKYTQTTEDLERNLCEQIQFLRASATSFDNGFEGEAKRLATTVRVLVHDTRKSKSLLHQLKIKGAIRMHNTSLPFNPANMAPHQGLVMLKMEVPAQGSGAITFTLRGEAEPFTDGPSDKPKAKVTYQPRVNAPDSLRKPTEVSFTDWWEEIVVKDSSGNKFSRKDIVLAMSDKEGGAHVDPTLDEDYARLAHFHSQGWHVKTSGVLIPPDNSLVSASVRQIAYELLVSIQNAFPGLCPEPD